MAKYARLVSSAATGRGDELTALVRRRARAHDLSASVGRDGRGDEPRGRKQEQDDGFDENGRADHLGSAGARGRQHRLRLSGRGYSARLRCACWSTRSATCWCATSRAPRTWPTATRALAAKWAWRSPHSGPGATNMVTGIATAMLDSSPLLCINRSGGQQADRIGRVPGDRRDRRHPADHQAQLPGVARRRDRPRDPRGAVRGALRPARAGAGRHHEGRAAGVDPRATGTRRTSSCRATGPTCALPTRSYRRAADLLNSAKRPIIFAGHGVLLSGAMAQGARARRTRGHSDRHDAARHRRGAGRAPRSTWG